MNHEGAKDTKKEKEEKEKYRNPVWFCEFTCVVREQGTGNRKDRIDTYWVLYGYATQAIKNQILFLY